ncbi:extracellular solute-binding protein [Paenibacillus sp. HJL G12]|uniref:Extracellular solute-binding protein n=1 Tax=Paenibacillus dendrobii TaxID=2691084 RepID=A0A7X3IER4_9BACL|nr:extracellular solute-binding protein [Paenibacillus dendrobii]MWV42567.1 extracellular solute-binding protein [Paenibacillus dendrobii]
MNTLKKSTWGKVSAIICVIPMLLSACGAPGASDKTSDDDKGDGGKKAVTISVTDTNRFLQNAEQEYEKTHPDVDIVIKPYREAQELAENQMATAMTQEEFEKYVSTVNTEMMSGKGPDILSMTGLPIGKYAEKDLLANSYDLMKDDSDFKKDHYFQNIWKASENDGKLLALPIDVKLNMMLVNNKLLQQAGVAVNQPWTWDDFVNVTEQVKKKAGDDIYANGNSEPQSYLYQLARENYSQLVDPVKKLAHFDSPLFRKWVEQVESMYKNEILTKESVDIDHALFSDRAILDPTSYIMFDDHETLKSPSVDKNNNHLSFYSTTFGINNNSPVKQEAWSFLKFLISDEMQESPEMNGMPINKTSYNKKFDDLVEQAKNGTVKTKYGDTPTTKTPEELEKFRPLIEEADSNSNTDSKVLQIVLEEIKTYYNGEKSLEEVIHLIQSRAMTYLNE